MHVINPHLEETYTESKQNLVLRALLQGEKLTGLQILVRFGAYRASSIMHRLRRRGYDIKTVMVNENNDTYGVYYIPDINNPKIS